MDRWHVKPGKTWRIRGRGRHLLICGDCVEAMASGVIPTRPSALVYDPPWHIPQGLDASGHASVLAFTNPQYMYRTIERFGAPTWLFVWDCMSGHYAEGRPLMQVKLALWYGDVLQFNPIGAFYGKEGSDFAGVADRRYAERELRGTKARGNRLAEIYRESISALHKRGAHRHEKPLDWIRLLIGDCFAPELIVVDPFAGSGTTLAACDQLGRSCIGIEKEPRYVAHILDRMTRMGAEVETL